MNPDGPHFRISFLCQKTKMPPWMRFMGRDLPQEQDPSNDVTADEVLVIDRVGHRVRFLLGFVWAFDFETFSNIIS